MLINQIITAIFPASSQYPLHHSEDPQTHPLPITPHAKGKGKYVFSILLYIAISHEFGCVSLVSRKEGTQTPRTWSVLNSLEEVCFFIHSFIWQTLIEHLCWGQTLCSAQNTKRNYSLCPEVKGVPMSSKGMKWKTFKVPSIITGCMTL